MFMTIRCPAAISCPPFVLPNLAGFMVSCSNTSYKVQSAPPGMQAASLDIEHAYHNLPIVPIHKTLPCCFME